VSPVTRDRELERLDELERLEELGQGSIELKENNNAN
jgi:hypothetical protein